LLSSMHTPIQVQVNVKSVPQVIITQSLLIQHQLTRLVMSILGITYRIVFFLRQLKIGWSRCFYNESCNRQTATLNSMPSDRALVVAGNSSAFQSNAVIIMPLSTGGIKQCCDPFICPSFCPMLLAR